MATTSTGNAPTTETTVAPADPGTTQPPTTLAPPTGEETIDVGTFEVGEEIDLVPGGVARLSGTDVEIELIEAHGPGDDCDDCPLGANLIVRSGGESVGLRYSFSGMMVKEVLTNARRKEAFGFIFVAARIWDDEMTVVVESGS